MRITVKSFGPEIVRLLGKELILYLGSGSTTDDLFKILEDEISFEFGLSHSIRDSGFTILINGRQLSTPHGRHLMDGDIVTILSPIGGG